MEVAFFDSYAILEIIESNENYTKFLNTIVVTTKLNLFEVYHSLLKNSGESKANEFIDSYNYVIADFDEEIIKEAAQLKLKYKKSFLSMVDGIGYVFAKKYSIKFLTGDKEFENMENVEFVK